jgi:glucan 1,3-beta-glucosidase
MTLSPPASPAGLSHRIRLGLLVAGLVFLSACAGGAAMLPQASAARPAASAGLSMLRTDGPHWVDATGARVLLKGTNLGNWLVQEFWMMEQVGDVVHDQCTLEAVLTQRFGYAEKERLIKLFRDNWIKERDWDQLKAFGFNLVRLPILWSVIEDEKKPKTLRADAWHYLDWAIDQARKRGIYVILDLHGAVGGQTPNDHTGCSGQNKYWTTPEYQDRTRWLWGQIAARYKDEPVVAAYDPLNEPWGSTAEDMAVRVTELYEVIRRVDARHIILLPSHYSAIDAYGDPAAKGMTNVAFELHPYPGLFGNRPGDSHFEVHRDWLRCGQSGTDGVCEWDRLITGLRTPLLMGEFQPWKAAGLEPGGKMARATYDTYASYHWASTSWAYKLVSIAGGQGEGTWGMVTNAANQRLDKGFGLMASASTSECARWNTTLAKACARKPALTHVKGSGTKTYYLVIKVSARSGSNPDISFDNLSLKNTATQEESLRNGGFGSGNGWTALAIGAPLALDYQHRETSRQPVGGDGTALRISRPVGVAGEINGLIYQKLSLQAGQTYALDGSFKDNASSRTWVEVYLTDQEPYAGMDGVAREGKVDFTTAPIQTIEALFKSYGEVAYDVHAGLARWLTTRDHNDVFDYPPRPTGLALQQTGGQVSLRWNAVPGSDVSYSVYRSTLAGVKGAPLAQNLTSTQFVDTGLSEHETYYYAVSAKNRIAEGFMGTPARTRLIPHAVPGKIEAEKYMAMSGIRTQGTTDAGGGYNLGYFDAGDHIDYKISAATAGTYRLFCRLASKTGSAGFEVLIDDSVEATHRIDSTDGWQNWVTQPCGTLTLSAGEHTLRLRAVGRDWNINWVELLGP